MVILCPSCLYSECDFAFQLTTSQLCEYLRIIPTYPYIFIYICPRLNERESQSNPASPSGEAKGVQEFGLSSRRSLKLHLFLLRYLAGEIKHDPLNLCKIDPAKVSKISILAQSR